MRKHRRRVIAALAILVIGGIGLLIIALGPREPVYQGKPLGFWLRQTRNPVPPVMPGLMGGGSSSSGGGGVVVPTQTTLSRVPLKTPPPPAANRPPAVGTALGASTALGLPRVDSNAVPYLLKSVKTKNGPFYNGSVAMWPKLPQWMQRRLSPPVDASVIRENAAILLADFCRADTAAQRAAGRKDYHNVVIVRALLEAKKDSDKSVREAAANALWLCDPEIAIKGRLE